MGTKRLLIQSTSLLALGLLVGVAVRHGFCGGTSKRGNLTKDLPGVPGRGPLGAAVEAAWWEDAVCSPIAYALGGGKIRTSGEASSKAKPTFTTTEGVLPDRRRMVLAVEDPGALPGWIGALSGEWAGTSGEPPLMREVLGRHPMELELIDPPLEPAGDPSETAARLAVASRAVAKAPPDRHTLLLYVPEGLLPGGSGGGGGDGIEWKSFLRTTRQGPGTTTVLVPSPVRSPGGGGTKGPGPASLVEDWMARQHVAESKRKGPAPPAPTFEGRMTREMPIEHFLAVLFPLLFPLFVPFFVSFLKELKRYRAGRADKPKAANR